MSVSDQTSERGLTIIQTKVLKAGHIFRRQDVSDFGIDAQFEIKENSAATGRLIAAQIKSGASYFSKEVHEGFWHTITDRHRELWVNHSLPVVLILCNVETEECFYQIVTEETCIRTGQNWKILVPKNKPLTAESTSDLVALASPIVAASDYTIEAEQDYSHANARRISMDIVVHPGSKATNRPLLGAIARSALTKGQSSKYYRDDLSRDVLGSRAVDVVSGFVYLREVDRQSASWACRFQWISSDLDPMFYPLQFEGEKDGSGLVIDWKNNTDWPKFLDDRRATKADYLKGVDELLALIPPLRETLTMVIETGREAALSDQFLEMVSNVEIVWDGSISAPRECQRLDRAVQKLLGNVGAAGLVWNQRHSRNQSATSSLMRGYQDQLDGLSNDIAFLRRDVR